MTPKWEWTLEGTGTPTWSSTPSGMATGGQDIADTISGQALVMTEGRLVLSSIGTVTATITGLAGTGGALGLIATYS